MRPSKIFLNLTVYLIYLQVMPSKQDGLEIFVGLKMSNYSTWLRSNNLDPSPIVPAASRFWATNNVTDLDCRISNHGVRGHSSEMVMDSISADITNKWFTTNFNITGNVTFYGDYKANGTIFSDRSINSTGHWYINVPFVQAVSYKIFFEETQSGNLEISYQLLAYLRMNNVLGNEHEIYFENLLGEDISDGDVKVVNQAMYSGFNLYLNNDRDKAEHPLRSQYLTYWEQVLAETTLADIIGTTLPPTTTTNPCIPVGSNVYESAEILNSTVIEKSVVVGADGVRRLVTKMVVVTQTILQR